MLSLRFRDDERRQLDEAAARAGQRLSEWARKALLTAADAKMDAD